MRSEPFIYDVDYRFLTDDELLRFHCEDISHFQTQKFSSEVVQEYLYETYILNKYRS